MKKIAQSVCIIFLSAATMQSAQSVTAPAEEWLTIFIHGTVGFRAGIALKSLSRLIGDQIDCTPYKRVAARIRRNPYFYQSQPIQDLGLHSIDLSDTRSGATVSLFARQFDDILRQESADKTFWATYYTFGWSGLISVKVRYCEAQCLYYALRELIDQYACEGKAVPKIRIVGYSHGGNIALNLARIACELNEEPFTIEELVLIGMPVQIETDYLVASSMFKNVYNIFSRSDKVQRLDFFSRQRFFSNRRFPKGRRPSHLVQIEVKVEKNCNAPHHVPDPLCKKCTHKRHINRSPGHSELWSFGWNAAGTSFYRPHFPLYPLPVAAFIPTIIATVKRYVPKMNDLIFIMRPDDGQALIRERYCKDKKAVPLLTPEKFVQLREEALRHKPEDYTGKSYNAQIRSIIKMETNERSMRRRRGRKNSCCGAGANVSIPETVSEIVPELPEDC